MRIKEYFKGKTFETFETELQSSKGRRRSEGVNFSFQLHCIFVDIM